MSVSAREDTILLLKLLTNEKRGVLKVVAFVKSPFKLFTLKFSNKVFVGILSISFLSRKSLTASQNEAKEKRKGKYSNREQMPLPPPL